MKYLFAYTYGAKKDGYPINGNGSMVINISGTKKITESMIFGENGAVKIVEDKLREESLYDVKVAPMGWFKFDKEEGD